MAVTLNVDIDVEQIDNEIIDQMCIIVVFLLDDEVEGEHERNDE